MIKFVSKILTNKTPIFLFANNKTYEYQINCELLTKYKQYKPSKNIQLMHAITMIKYQEEMQQVAKSSKWKDDDLRVEEIVTYISGELHLVSHKEINYLMAVLKQRGYTYQRDIPIFKALNKQVKLCFGNHYEANQLLKSLIMLKSLHFQKNTWIKLIQGFLSINSQENQQKKKLNLNPNDLFKISILILQQPFIPLFLIKKLIQRITKQTAKTLQSLSSLYHISQILDICLYKQVQYQYTRSSIKDIIFNSYNIQAETNKQEIIEKDRQQSQKQAVSEQYQLGVKRKLTQIKSQIVKTYQSSIDIQKLQKQIIKMIENDEQHITKSIMLFTSDIKQLKPYIYQYLNHNLNKLTPIQFISLARKCESESAKSYFKQYLLTLGQYMNIEEKAYLYIEMNRAFMVPIQPQIIMKLIAQITQITYGQFMAVSKLVSLLPAHYKGRIGQILAAVKQKVPKQ